MVLYPLVTAVRAISDQLRRAALEVSSQPMPMARVVMPAWSARRFSRADACTCSATVAAGVGVASRAASRRMMGLRSAAGDGSVSGSTATLGSPAWSITSEVSARFSTMMIRDWTFSPVFRAASTTVRAVATCALVRSSVGWVSLVFGIHHFP